jgi:hypothetical protein
MSGKSRKKKAASVSPGVRVGFQVADIESLGRKIAKAVGKHLALNHPQIKKIETSRGSSLRVANTPPITRGEDGKYPLLMVREPTERDGAFLEVAVDHDWQTGYCYLTHVSLKLYIGTGPSTSALRFRAEWDPRDAAKLHAQPHWNIDQTEQSLVKSVSESPPWVSPARRAPWAVQSNEPQVATAPNDLKSFHFAMASCWHEASPHHSPPIADEEALVRWIGGCTGYIKDQLSQ